MPGTVKLVIEHVPPSYWEWQKMGHWKQRALIHMIGFVVHKALKIAGTRRMKTPCVVNVDIYKKRGSRGRKMDPSNIWTPVDKLYIDWLTEPKGNKKRGYSFLPDDTPDILQLGNALVHVSSEKSETILTFTPTQTETE